MRITYLLQGKAFASRERGNIPRTGDLIEFDSGSSVAGIYKIGRITWLDVPLVEMVEIELLDNE